jgi:hypothetical protein
MQKIDSCGKVIHTGDVQGSEKRNDTCMKTMQCENKISLYFLDPFLAYRAIKSLHILAGNSKKKIMIIFVLKTFGYSFSRINPEENNMFL